jgi:hypothetical protein
MNETDKFNNEIINIIKLQNPVLIEWEKYTFEKLHDNTESFHSRCLLILYELYSIQNNDIKNRTMNCAEIVGIRRPLIEMLIEYAEINKP